MLPFYNTSFILNILCVFDRMVLWIPREEAKRGMDTQPSMIYSGSRPDHNARNPLVIIKAHVAANHCVHVILIFQEHEIKNKNYSLCVLKYDTSD